MISTIGTSKDLKRYNEEIRGCVDKILDGMASGHLKVCPTAELAERPALEKRL
jgi:hypothetical protein